LAKKLKREGLLLFFMGTIPFVELISRWYIYYVMV